MDTLIILALLGFGIWAIVVLAQRVRGKRLIDQMQHERDEVTWAAAAKVALLVKPKEVVEAEQASQQAHERFKKVVSRLTVHEYEHAIVDVRLADDNLKLAIGGCKAAQTVHDAVTALYTKTIGECINHPRRAHQRYPKLAGCVEQIVQAVALHERQTKPALRLIKGGKDTPITQAELADFRRSLNDGRFDAWVRDLKV